MAPQWRPCPSPLRCCSGLLLVSPWLYFLASVSLQDRAQPASREEGGDGGGDRADTWARSRVAIIEDTSIAQLPQMTPVPIRGGATFTDAFALAQARQPQAPARPRQAPVPLSSAPDLAVGKDQTPKPPEPESGGSCPSLLVALAATSSQIEGAVVVIASALAHASAPESLKFRVITYAADAAALVGGLRARLGRKADLRAVAFDEWKPRVSELLGRQETFASRRELFDELNFAAFYLHELFPNTDRVLYLDTDTVVQTDLACELATGRLDLKGRPAAGAKDCSQNIGKYVNFEKMKKHDVASRLPLQLKAKPSSCVINRGVVLVDTAAWSQSNITRAIELLVARHLSRDGPFWKSGVSQPPFLLAVSGRFLDLGVEWNVRGLGRANISPDEVAELKKRNMWDPYFDGFLLKCKFHCCDGCKDYSLTPYLAPYAERAKVLHFNGELKPLKAGRRTDAPLPPLAKGAVLKDRDRAARELQPLCSCGHNCVRECAGLWWKYLPV